MRFHRHDLVWLKPHSFYNKSLKTWLENFPCVVARSDNLAPGYFHASICFSSEKTPDSRFSFAVNKEDVIRQSPPLSLEKVVKACNLSSLQSTCDALNSLGYNPCVYGSFAWQVITGKVYTSKTSDIDLLLYIQNKGQLDNLKPLLIEAQNALDRTIDGELIFDGDYATAWREWYSSNDKVLVKTINNVFLVSKHDILERIIGK